MIAILGVMCMLAFVVLPSVMQMMQTGGGGGDQVVVTTKYGSINESELRSMRQAREITNRFVADLMRRSGADPRLLRNGQIFGGSSEQEVVNAMLMARRAEEMGVIVSDDAVRLFIREVTQNQVSSDDMRLIIDGLNVQQNHLFDALRAELAAQQVSRVLTSGVGPISASPAERYDYFRRVSARIRAEAVEVPVADFVDKVAAPSDADLAAFYEEYKDELPNSGTPEPGFRQPKMVAADVITVEYASFVDTEAVTAEEVEKYYQEHLDDYKSISALIADSDDEDEIEVDPGDANIPLLDRAETLVVDRDITAGPAPDYTPLWDAESGIRDKLAAEAATGRMEEALTAAETEMVAYEKKRKQWDIAQATDDSAPEPTPINLAEMASANGLSAEQIALIAPADMFENHKGLASSVVTGRSIAFYYVAYGDSQTYTTIKSTDADGNRYLVWLTDLSEEKTPSLEDIKGDVEAAWRFQQARALAIEHANELATEARDNQGGDGKSESLATTFSGDDAPEIITTGSFSWLTTGNVPQFSSSTYRYSEIEGIEQPGRDFMQTAFSLAAGEVGVATNQPESIAYVIRVSSEDTPTELLQSRFFSANQNMYLQIGQSDVQEVFITWRDNLIADAGVHWERPAYVETR